MTEREDAKWVYEMVDDWFPKARPPAERILDGFWTWVGEHIIGRDSVTKKFIAVHQTGSQITPKGDERTDEDRVRELVERCSPRATP